MEFLLVVLERSQIIFVKWLGGLASNHLINLVLEVGLKPVGVGASVLQISHDFPESAGVF